LVCATRTDNPIEPELIVAAIDAAEELALSSSKQAARFFIEDLTPETWVASQVRGVNKRGAELISNSLTELAARINEAHEAVASAQKGTLEYAIKTGELLQEAKNKLKHGAWSKWLELNCPNIPARTATDYMKLAEHQSRLGLNRQRAADLSIRGALSAIKPGPETRQQPKKSKPDLVGLLHNLAADELLTALEAARWDAERLTALAHCIKRVKATVAVEGGSSKKCTTGEAPEQVQPEPDAVKRMLMEIAIYVVQRDGRVDPNDYDWRLLVLRAKATLEFEASAGKLFPVAREQ
jgi:hypothetical protein